MKAPELQIQALLRTTWEKDATVLGEQPEIDTGSYDHSVDEAPKIAITEGDEGPIGGGDTGYTAANGAGKGGTQRVGGARTVDCVAGSVDDLRGAGPDGEDLHPQQLRWDLYHHTTQLLVDGQLETDMMWVAPGEAQQIAQEYEDSGAVDTVFSAQFRALYGYDRSPR